MRGKLGFTTTLRTARLVTSGPFVTSGRKRRWSLCVLSVDQSASLSLSLAGPRGSHPPPSVKEEALPGRWPWAGQLALARGVSTEGRGLSTCFSLGIGREAGNRPRPTCRACVALPPPLPPGGPSRPPAPGPRVARRSLSLVAIFPFVGTLGDCVTFPFLVVLCPSMTLPESAVPMTVARCWFSFLSFSLFLNIPTAYVFYSWEFAPFAPLPVSDFLTPFFLLRLGVGVLLQERNFIPTYFFNYSLFSVIIKLKKVLIFFWE